MKDITERLREHADEVLSARNEGAEDLAGVLEEAAHKIDELRSLVEVYKEKK